MFICQPLASTHDRAAFLCGNESLDDFIQKRARKENALGSAAVFILEDENNSSKIVGYYSLSSFSIELSSVPEKFSKKLPKYPNVPVILLGRMARSLEYKGKGIGEILLIDALKRSFEIRKQVGSVAVVVDAIDKNAETFYEKYEFLRIPGDPGNRFFLPMSSIEALIEFLS